MPLWPPILDRVPISLASLESSPGLPSTRFVLTSGARTSPGLFSNTLTINTIVNPCIIYITPKLTCPASRNQASATAGLGGSSPRKMTPPTTPLTSRMRQLGLDALPRTGRSADSGYGSVETSPTKLTLHIRSEQTLQTSLSFAARLESESLQSYDGTGSEASDSKEFDNGSEPELLDSPSVGHEKFATLPRAARRRISRTDSYPVQLDRPAYHPRHGSDTAISASRVGSLRALDRFVPLRDHATPGSEKMRTTRALEELTLSERLVRHNQDAPDPFCFRRRPLPPSPTEARKARRPSQGRTVLDNASQNQTDRRVSHGHLQTHHGVRHSKSTTKHNLC